jgi:hypothetical protein
MKKYSTIYIALALSACTTVTPGAALSTPLPLPAATATYNLGGQQTSLQLTERALQQTRGAFEVSQAIATQSAQATQNTLNLRNSDLQFQLTAQAATQSAQNAALSFDMTRSASTQMFRATGTATARETQRITDEANWWWWVNSLAAIVIIGSLGWLIVGVGEALRTRIQSDTKRVRVIRTIGAYLILTPLSNGQIQREVVPVLSAPVVDDVIDNDETAEIEDDEMVEGTTVSRSEVVYSSKPDDRSTENKNRALGLRWLKDAIAVNGVSSSIIPRYDKMGWYSEDWQNAKKLFSDVTTVQRGVGTFVSGRHKTLGELMSAVAERRYTPRITLENSPAPSPVDLNSAVL